MYKGAWLVIQAWQLSFKISTNNSLHLILTKNNACARSSIWHYIEFKSQPDLTAEDLQLIQSKVVHHSLTTPRTAIRRLSLAVVSDKLQYICIMYSLYETQLCEMWTMDLYLAYELWHQVAFVTMEFHWGTSHLDSHECRHLLNSYDQVHNLVCW